MRIGHRGERRIAFPARYVFLSIGEPIRQERMLERERARGLGEDRAQRKTARYGRLVEPQTRFFRALGARFPDWVVFFEAVSLEAIVACVESLGKLEKSPGDLQVLDFVEGWLATGDGGQ